MTAHCPVEGQWAALDSLVALHGEDTVCHLIIHRLGRDPLAQTYKLDEVFDSFTQSDADIALDYVRQVVGSPVDVGDDDRERDERRLEALDG